MWSDFPRLDGRRPQISDQREHSKGHVAVLDSNGGYIILYNNTLARQVRRLVRKETVKEPGATCLCI